LPKIPKNNARSGPGRVSYLSVLSSKAKKTQAISPKKIIGASVGRPDSESGAAQDFRAEQQLCPTKKEARRFVMRPPFAA
jgi:hypothetical protein